MIKAVKGRKVDLTEEQLCYTIGYLLSGKVQAIAAQVPESYVNDFKKQYTGEYISAIKEKETVSGFHSKYGVQCSINFKSFKNIPSFLKPYILYYGTSYGNNTVCGSLNRNSFIYELVNKYGFTFGSKQNRDVILQNVVKYHNNYFDYTIKGMQA